MKQTFIQNFFMAILPPSWADDMRRESQQWKLTCPACRHERSFWEIGGIRWKAIGNQRSLLKCPHCGRLTWHKAHHKID